MRFCSEDKNTAKNWLYNCSENNLKTQKPKGERKIKTRNLLILVSWRDERQEKLEKPNRVQQMEKLPGLVYCFSRNFLSETIPKIWLKQNNSHLHYLGKYFPQYRPRGKFNFFFFQIKPPSQVGVCPNKKNAIWSGGLLVTGFFFFFSLP